MVNRLLSKMLIFLIIDFKILGHVQKRNSFLEYTIFKGVIFLYFQTATCYNSSLCWIPLSSKLRTILLVLNLTETLWFLALYAVLLMLERLWTLLQLFSADAKVTHAQDISSVIATNKLKSKVLKNNTMNGKNLRIIWWMVKEGQ